MGIAEWPQNITDVQNAVIRIPLTWTQMHAVYIAAFIPNAYVCMYIYTYSCIYNHYPCIYLK